MSAATAKTRPEIHDPSLRQALEEAAPAIESFTTNLDRLSSDIKNLESYLERSGLRATVSVSMKRGQDPSEELIWTKGEPERWRIIFERVYFNTQGQDLRCALIEAPIDARVSARRFLPDLVRALAKAAQLGGEADSSASNDDPPF